MKKIYLTFLLLTSLAFVNDVKAQRLSVGDPHNEWWYYNTGTIEDAEFTIQPEGLYLEVGMYLTFSGRGAGYTRNDTIETVCEFNLPEGAIMHDSWLWLNQDTLIADLIDRWTATSIYNQIVGRRQDPSILYKTWGNNYELRIYPMLGDSTRRVKLSYLLPLNFNSNSVFARLPMELLKLSKNTVKSAKIRVKVNDQFKNPGIMEYPELTFSEASGGTDNTNYLLSINSDDYESEFTLRFDTPMKDGIYINNYNDQENFYQLAFLPATIIDNIEPKKVMICVDFDNEDTRVTKDEVFAHMKNTIINGLSPQDSFNIMFSGVNGQPVMPNWTAVANASVVFDNIGPEDINNYSLLPALLYAAAQHQVNQKGDDILLIANSFSNGSPESANQIIDETMEAMGGELIPIHIANLRQNSSQYYHIGGTYYAGNDYLYVNLAKLTNGNYSKYEYWNQSLHQFLFDFAQKAGGLISSFDIHTSLDDGFCYSRFNVGNDDGLFYTNKPFLQVGKYYGNLPFKVEVAGIFNNQPFSKQITIGENQIVECDSLAEEIWAGNHIEFLEDQVSYYSNEVIREIIDYSNQERVLSVYTAFLAVEPGIETDVDVVDDDGDVVIAIEEKDIVDEDQKIVAYPNPFVTQVNFDLNWGTETVEQINVSIYDITGRKIFSDEINNLNGLTQHHYVWKGKNSSGRVVPEGTYLVVFYNDSFKKVVKIIKPKQ